MKKNIKKINIIIKCKIIKVDKLKYTKKYKYNMKLNEKLNEKNIKYN